MPLASVVVLFLASLLLLISLSLLRLAYILPTSRTPRPATPVKSTATLLVVLGSGGHTAEMIRLLDSLNFTKYTYRRYIVSSGDTLSEGKARHFEQQKAKPSFDVVHVPRARKVGQSWLTTPFTSLQCLLGSLSAVLSKPLPDAVLCNGPGTCVLICIAALIPRFWGVKYIRIVYVESFARVTALSLSGKILIYFADRFLVQWPELAKRYPKAEYVGILV